MAQGTATWNGGDGNWNDPEWRNASGPNGLPGTAVFVAHMPETGRTAFFASTSDVLRFDAVVDPVLDGMLAEAGVEQQ